ncbi:tetratricopeptide repeat protein [Zooshikella sp. RANM57]|uniref:tetratricopeptide repeat protein n=1 Tax=Zooshikella sp. RANM57 TaxID=3425863 RepID=UPI003D6E41C6
MDSEQLYKQATAFEAKKDFASALPIYKQITSNSDDPRFFIAFGRCLQKLGHWKQSVAPLEKGIALKPHYCEGDARLFLAESYLKIGKTKQAIAQWHHVAKMKPEYPSYEAVPKEAKKMLAQYAK